MRNRAHVPHFRELLTGVLDPRDMHDYADFCRIPTLTKVMLQNAPDRFRSDEWALDQLVVEYTSGSTGVPFRSYKSHRDVNASTLALWAARRRSFPGVAGRRGASFYAFTNEGGVLRTDPVKVMDGMLYLSLFYMRDDMFKRYWNALVEFQPAWIVGTPTVVSQLAEYIVREKSAERHRISIHLAEIGGEVSFPGQHRVIQQAFGCPVTTHYGARELWPIAYSCPKSALHIVDHHAFVEVLHQDGTPCAPGEQGTIHVTSLNYEAAPLIRYQLGDLGRFSPDSCGCGTAGPVLSLDGGRAAQYIVRRDGTEVSPVILFYILNKLLGKQQDAVQQIQMMQTDYDHFVVSVVARSEWDPAIARELREELGRILGPVFMDFQLVDRITPSDRTGKTQFFFSQVPRPRPQGGGAWSV